jgi:hypothetical protein
MAPKQLPRCIPRWKFQLNGAPLTGDDSSIGQYEADAGLVRNPPCH